MINTWLILPLLAYHSCISSKNVPQRSQRASSSQQHVFGRDAISKHGGRRAFPIEGRPNRKLMNMKDVQSSQSQSDVSTPSQLPQTPSTATSRRMQVALDGEIGDKTVNSEYNKISSQPLGRQSLEILRRYQGSAQRLSYADFVSSSNSSIDGSITTYEFQNDLTCSESPSNVAAVVLGKCFSISLSYDDDDLSILDDYSQTTYATMTMNSPPTPADHTLTINVIYYEDISCTSPSGSVDVLELPRDCSPLTANHTFFPTSAYYNYSSTLVDTFPSHGVLTKFVILFQQ